MERTLCSVNWWRCQAKDGELWLCVPGDGAQGEASQGTSGVSPGTRNVSQTRKEWDATEGGTGAKKNGQIPELYHGGGHHEGKLVVIILTTQSKRLLACQFAVGQLDRCSWAWAAQSPWKAGMLAKDKSRKAETHNSDRCFVGKWSVGGHGERGQQ